MDLRYKVEAKLDVKHFFDVHGDVMAKYQGKDLLSDKDAMARVQKDFYDTMAVGYQKMIDADAESGGVFQWRVNRCANYDEKHLFGKRILFVGAGNSRTAMIYASRGYDVVSTDISFNMLKVGKERAEQYGIKMMYVCHNAELPFPFKSDVFDTVYSYCVMNHITDWNNYLTEKMRCLKEGGVLLERMPNALRWDFWQGMGEMNEGMEIKAKYCSPDSTKAILNELGLKGEIFTHDRQEPIDLFYTAKMSKNQRKLILPLSKNIYKLRTWFEDSVLLPIKDDGRGLYTVFKIKK